MFLCLSFHYVFLNSSSLDESTWVDCVCGKADSLSKFNQSTRHLISTFKSLVWIPVAIDPMPSYHMLKLLERTLHDLLMRSKGYLKALHYVICIVKVVVIVIVVCNCIIIQQGFDEAKAQIVYQYSE